MSNSCYSVNANLKRILNILGSQPSISIPTLGTDLLNNCPAGGYANPEEMIRGVGYDEAQLKKILPHVTTHSWKNSVANPVPISEAEIGKYAIGTALSAERPKDGAGLPIYRYGHNRSARMGTVNAEAKELMGHPDYGKVDNLLLIDQTTWPLRFYNPASGVIPFRDSDASNLPYQLFGLESTYTHAIYSNDALH